MSIGFDAQVIVVGGGPAGASTAWHLARAGVDVLVLDRARFPRDKTCAECLSPESARLLDAMGALDALSAVGAKLRGMVVRAPSGDEIRGGFVAAHGWRAPRDWGLAVSRRVLDATLVARARAVGARVREGARVADVVRDAAGRVCGVRVLDASGATTELRARIVVGADGLRSVIVRRLGLARVRAWPRRLALVAHWRGVDGITDHGEMHVERDGFVGIADIGDGVTNTSMVVPAREAQRISGDPASYLASWIRGRAHLAPRFAAAERVDTVRVTGPFASASRRGWAPGAALVGDAADFFDPFTGEGVFAALRGGEILAPFVAESCALPAARADRALAGYETARRRAFGGKWAVERIIGAVVDVPPLMNRAAHTLSRRRDLADLLVGVAGDFVPPSAVLNARYVWRVFVK
ncbi:monooxygenase FAD-binding protein [Gemmatirosa kalamazoonensis]|uniref:Monooxygenase FAD-binding protein n=1 Tax=Gemmatirosa kalamazoonensis TaxID=861299 RepID=W0RQC8_9BACT|nr:NAD(P)/FAD-dependent oxidoreductase [Gemmatirosa kalamazoonensis]AHG91718.1 monooxygenase FAD-binding protein [Gemmatirosa kalamazoonensis]